MTSGGNATRDTVVFEIALDLVRREHDEFISTRFHELPRELQSEVIRRSLELEAAK